MGQMGKVLVLDYGPVNRESRLLQVRLHVPADVNVVAKNLVDGRSLVYADGKIYISYYDAYISIFPPDGGKMKPKGMLKHELQHELENYNLPTNGKVAELKDRLNRHLNDMEEEYHNDSVNTGHVLLSEDVKSWYIAKLSDSMLIMASDRNRKLYTITLKSDGVVMKGEVVEAFTYPEMIHHVTSISLGKDNFIFCAGVAQDGHAGGLIKANLSTQDIEVVVENHSEACGEFSV